MDETEVSQRAPSGAALRRTDSGCTHTWGAVRRKRPVILNITFRLPTYDDPAGVILGSVSRSRYVGLFGAVSGDLFGNRNDIDPGPLEGICSGFLEKQPVSSENPHQHGGADAKGVLSVFNNTHDQDCASPCAIMHQPYHPFVYLHGASSNQPWYQPSFRFVARRSCLAIQLERRDRSLFVPAPPPHPRARAPNISRLNIIFKLATKRQKESMVMNFIEFNTHVF